MLSAKGRFGHVRFQSVMTHAISDCHTGMLDVFMPFPAPVTILSKTQHKTFFQRVISKYRPTMSCAMVVDEA